MTPPPAGVLHRAWRVSPVISQIWNVPGQAALWEAWTGGTRMRCGRRPAVAACLTHEEGPEPGVLGAEREENDFATCLGGKSTGLGDCPAQAGAGTRLQSFLLVPVWGVVASAR